MEGGGDGRYVPTGHVVYALGNVLLAAPFDLGRMEKTGGTVAVLDPVGRAFSPRNANTPISANYNFSSTGTLVHLPDVGALPRIVRTLALVDRHDGTVEELMADHSHYKVPEQIGGASMDVVY